MRLALALLLLAFTLPALAATNTAQHVRHGGGEVTVINADDDATGSVIMYFAYPKRWRLHCIAASGTPDWTLATAPAGSATFNTISTISASQLATWFSDDLVHAVRLSFANATGAVSCYAAAAE